MAAPQTASGKLQEEQRPPLGGANYPDSSVDLTCATVDSQKVPHFFGGPWNATQNVVVKGNRSFNMQMYHENSYLLDESWLILIDTKYILYN